MLRDVSSDVQRFEEQAVVERNLARTATTEEIAAIHTSLANGYAELAEAAAVAPIAPELRRSRAKPYRT